MKFSSKSWCYINARDFTEICQLVSQIKRAEEQTPPPHSASIFSYKSDRDMWNCDMGGSHINDSLCRIGIVVTWFSEFALS
jgi:hypothetical protein